VTANRRTYGSLLAAAGSIAWVAALIGVTSGYSIDFRAPAFAAAILGLGAVLLRSGAGELIPGILAGLGVWLACVGGIVAGVEAAPEDCS